jgi:hypothetical protein
MVTESFGLLHDVDFLAKYLGFTQQSVRIVQDSGHGDYFLVVIESSILWDKTPCSPFKVHPRFGGTCRRGINQQEAGSKQIHSLAKVSGL